MSKLRLFDIDGTLTQAMGLTDGLFVETVEEVVGLDGVSRVPDASFQLDDYADLQKILETLEAAL